MRLFKQQNPITIGAFQLYILVTEDEMRGMKWLDQKEGRTGTMDTYMDTTDNFKKEQSSQVTDTLVGQAGLEPATGLLLRLPVENLNFDAKLIVFDHTLLHTS